MGTAGLPSESSLAAPRESRDLFGSWGTFLVLWGAPIALGVLASAAYARGWPLQDAYATWILATVWFGLACLSNALRCGRVHCWVDGLGMPSLAALGILGLMGLVPLSLGWYGIGFWSILVASFCVELCWRRYV